MRKNRLIDIDGTICTDISNENSEMYPMAVVFPGAVERINQWYASGDFITFFTAREEKDRKVTEDWLSLHGFHYNNLIMGKPRSFNKSYYWLDNANGEYQNFNGNWFDVID